MDGLRDVLPNDNSELPVEDVKFHYREKEIVGTIMINTSIEHIEEAKNQAQYLINKALAKLCFAYNTEAILQKGCYITDLKYPSTETVWGQLMLRSGFLLEDPVSVLNKMTLLPENTKKTLDLALAYYKLSYYR